MSVLSLDDAKAFLNLTSAADNAEVQTTIDAAEAAIARRVGPLSSTTVTERVYGCGYGSKGRPQLRLNTLPVISVTSITPYGGSALSLTNIDAAASGVVRYLDGTMFADVSSYTVVYQAGWATVPNDVLLAIKEMVRHLWASQRGSGFGRPGAAPPETLANTLPSAVNALPITVERLLAKVQVTTKAGFA